MREAFATAKTADEAIEIACAELGLPREEVEVEILEFGKKGLFSRPTYKVRVFVEEPEIEMKKEEPKKEIKAKKEPKKEKKAPEVKTPEVSEEELSKEIEPTEAIKAKIGAAVAYVEAIIRELKLEGAAVTYKYTRGGLKISIDGDDVGVIIGKRGEALDALQTLTSLAVNKREEEYLKISINSGDYREKRKKTLEELALKVAKTVSETGRKHTFEPMSAYERRIIHSAVSAVEGVTSKSFGEEPERKVVILSNNPRPSRGGDRRSSRNGGGRRPEKAERPVGGTNHSDDSAYFSLLDELQ